MGVFFFVFVEKKPDDKLSLSNYRCN